MRFRDTHYSNTRSTVFSITIYETETEKLGTLAPYIKVIAGDYSVSDKVHALLMITNDVERYRNAQASQRKTSSTVPASRESEADRTEEPVSV